MRAKTNVLVGWKQRMKARAIGSTKDNFPQEHTSATIYCTGKRRDKRFWAKEENLVSDAASRTYNELANVTDEWFASQKSLFKHEPAKVEKDRQKKNLAPFPMDASPGQQQNTPVCCVRHTSLFKTNTRRTTLLQRQAAAECRPTTWHEACAEHAGRKKPTRFLKTTAPRIWKVHISCTRWKTAHSSLYFGPNGSVHDWRVLCASTIAWSRKFWTKSGGTSHYA